MSKRGFQKRRATRAETLRCLIIVARRRARLYQHLRRAFADIEAIRVILDRRVGERRQWSKPRTPERRTQTRRRIDDQLSEVGCAFVLPGGSPELATIHGELLDALAQHPKIHGIDWRTIAVLLRSSSPFNARQIATRLALDYGSVKRSVRKLIARNILRRTPVGLVVQSQTDRWEHR